jgi:hypothetical protein
VLVALPSSPSNCRVANGVDRWSSHLPISCRISELSLSGVHPSQKINLFYFYLAAPGESSATAGGLRAGSMTL